MDATYKNPKQLYKKLFQTYSTISICVVLILVLFFIYMTKLRITETNLDYLRIKNTQVTDFLKRSADVVDNLNNDLYQSTAAMEDLMAYLKMTPEEYQRYRLNTYMNSPSNSYMGIDGFIEQTMKKSSNISHVAIVSYDSFELTSFYPDSNNRRSIKDASYVKSIRSGAHGSYGEITFLKEIRNPSTLQNVGCMIVYFPTTPLMSIHNSYAKSDTMTFDENGQVRYSSLPSARTDTLLHNPDATLDEQLITSYTEDSVVKEYTTYSYISKSSASQIPFSLFVMIVGLGGFVLLVSILFIKWHLIRLTNRLDYILSGMQRVTTGDLSVRLTADQTGDELDLISANFNTMCRELNRYIEKSYLAEIEQKNAEMEVLQNQINPHFLYNTLEAIRMKAVINGDKEVGKMLYSLSVIYRSQLKEADIITLVQEIHYCKKYLELFEFRYQGKFTAYIDCPEELMYYPVIKFLIQPVLENYFVHGIRGESTGNEIRIFAVKDETTLYIHVMDNGRGLSKEKLEETNNLLAHNHSRGRESIGLININRRIKAFYGSDYGVLLSHHVDGGLHVTLKLGLGEEVRNEKNTISGR